MMKDKFKNNERKAGNAYFTDMNIVDKMPDIPISEVPLLHIKVVTL